MGKNSRTSPLGKQDSVWMATTRKTDFPVLGQKHKFFDVVVVGGGITGITTAFLLKRAGKSVCIVEARRIITGTTGFTTAKLTSLHGQIYKHLASVFGKEKAKLYGQANEEGLALVGELIAKNKIDCDFVKSPAFTFCEDEVEIPELEKEYKVAKSLGLPAKFITKGLALPAIKAAVEFENQAFFHPRKYLLKMASLFNSPNTPIFEKTRALDISESPSGCLVKTDHGNIAADYVVVATQAPFYDPAFYYARQAPERSYVLALETKNVDLNGMYYQSGESYNSFRPHITGKKKYIIVGGQAHKVGQGEDILKRFGSLALYSKKNFSFDRISYHWGAQDFYTGDRVPFIGKISPKHKRVFVATGFGGWGMTTGTVAGTIIRDLILKRKNKYIELYDPNRVKAQALPLMIKEGVDTTKRYATSFLNHKKIVPSKLKKGQAEVGVYKKRKVAAFRDKSGKLVVLSATCTHLGCTVSWNNAEKSWDCPCHGSRFSATGEVLNAPAISKLEAVKAAS
ncbi:FAD-dependent oxidoreductase [Candidatus Curtissbacteria bacterium]|nr:FAD-dependent oxidoreductase [Candidatus Curtissbacteria bacterium]